MARLEVRRAAVESRAAVAEARARQVEARARESAAAAQVRLYRTLATARTGVPAGPSGGPLASGTAYPQTRPSRFGAMGGAEALAGAHFSGAADRALTGATRARLRQMSQHALRTSSIARTLLSAVVRQVVGAGMRLHARSGDSAWNAAAERWWERWLDDRADARGLLGGGALQRLWLRSMLADGDVGVLCVRGWRVQTIEAERIGGPGRWNEPIEGVRTDAYGRPVRYWIADYDRHGHVRRDVEAPGAGRWVGAENFHLLVDPQRASQSRGEPVFARALDRLQQLERYVEATVVASEVGACFALARYTSDPGRVAGLAPGRSDRGGASPGAEAPLAPGAMIDLGVADKIEQIKPEHPHTQSSAFIRDQLRLLGMELGLPLELVMLDTSQATAYAGRTAILLAEPAAVELRQALERRVLAPLWRWAVAGAMETGELSGRDSPPVGWDRVESAPPPSPLFEPVKDVAAFAEMVRHNFTTKRQISERYFGGDWDAVLAERGEEVAAQRAAGCPESDSATTRRVVQDNTPAGVGD
jgi:capsid protein